MVCAAHAQYLCACLTSFLPLAYERLQSEVCVLLVLLQYYRSCEIGLSTKTTSAVWGGGGGYCSMLYSAQVEMLVFTSPLVMFHREQHCFHRHRYRYTVTVSVMDDTSGIGNICEYINMFANCFYFLNYA